MGTTLLVSSIDFVLRPRAYCTHPQSLLVQWSSCPIPFPILIGLLQWDDKFLTAGTKAPELLQEPSRLEATTPQPFPWVTRIFDCSRRYVLWSYRWIFLTDSLVTLGSKLATSGRPYHWPLPKVMSQSLDSTLSYQWTHPGTPHIN